MSIEYDTDILIWSEHQADLLRRLAAGERVNDHWGRIGRLGRVKVDPHAELAIGQTAARQLEARKRHRGYG